MKNQENNEPTGWGENEKRNDISTNASKENTQKHTENDNNSGLAANADGNVEEKSIKNPNPEDLNDGKGFLGDYAKPQHDD